MNTCQHLSEMRAVVPSADGCEDCLKIGGHWVHLRLCEICGHVGCCDSSPYRHAGCPSFVEEPPSDGIKREPETLNDIKQYVANVASWLRP